MITPDLYIFLWGGMKENLFKEHLKKCSLNKEYTDMDSSTPFRHKQLERQLLRSHHLFLGQVLVLLKSGLF